MTQERFGYIFCVFFLVCLAGAKAQMQDVDAVANLQLEFSRDGSRCIQVSWDAASQAVDHYTVFTGLSEPGQLRFHALSHKAKFSFSVRSAGRYYVMIIAQRDMRTSDPTIGYIDISAADVRNPAHGGQIDFKSEAPTTAISGETYQYTPLAQERENQELKFDLLDKPAGMYISQATGQITWTPAEAGEYEITLRARIVHDPQVEALQHWHVRVVEAHNNPLHACVDVDVHVALPGSTPIYAATVTAIRADRAFTTDDDYAVRKLDVVSAALNYGKARMRLAAGDYIFRVEDDQIYTTWSGGVRSPQYAKKYSFSCDASGPVREVRFTAHARDTDPDFRIVRGQVRDAVDGQGIRSMVIFQPAVSHPRPDILGSGSLKVVFTDHEGKFNDGILADVAYVAEAICLLADPVTEQPIYYNMFNGQTLSPLEAPILRTSSQPAWEALNFELPRLPAHNTKIGFRIGDPEASLRLGGTAVFYLLDRSTEPWGMQIVRSESASATRTLDVLKLPEGEYITQYIPWSKGHPVHFFGPNSQPVSTPQEARIFTVRSGQNGVHEAWIAQLAPLQGVLQTRGSAAVWPVGVSASRPAHGALVYAFDETGVLVDFAVADENGEFLIDRLGLGTYSLYVNKGQCAAEVFEIERSYAEFESTIQQLDINCDAGVTSIEDFANVPASQQECIKLAPHPADNTLHIAYQVPGQFYGVDAGLELRVFDLTGHPLIRQHLGSTATNVQTSANGINTVDLELDVSALPDGIYILEMRSGASVERRPVLIRH